MEQLHKQVDDPAVFGRINEIWARLTVLRERAKSTASGAKTIINGNEFGDIANVSNGLEGASAAGEKVHAILTELDWNRDDEQLEKLAKVLKAQQLGISFLSEILLSDTAKVEDIIELLLHHHNGDHHHHVHDKADHDLGSRIR